MKISRNNINTALKESPEGASKILIENEIVLF
jgi:hypothetical protein